MSDRSGFDDYSNIHGNELYDASFKRVGKRTFTHTVFHPQPGLWNEDRTFLKPYRGQKYDAKKWKLEEGAWDHEHCTVCGFTIVDGHSFWDTGEGCCLCDACYEYYLGGGEAVRTGRLK